MVPTPTLTASASNSAISASDNPESCWRLSAQNQTASGRRALRWPSDSTQFQHRRQDQRRAEQQRREHGKARDQRIAEPQQARRRRRTRRAPARPATSASGAAPVARPAAARRPAPAGGSPWPGSRSRPRSAPSDADGDAGDPPFGLERQLPGNLRAIEPAQGWRRHRATAPPRSDSRRPARPGPRPAPATPARAPAPR